MFQSIQIERSSITHGDYLPSNIYVLTPTGQSYFFNDHWYKFHWYIFPGTRWFYIAKCSGINDAILNTIQFKWISLTGTKQFPIIGFWGIITTNHADQKYGKCWLWHHTKKNKSSKMPINNFRLLYGRKH